MLHYPNKLNASILGEQQWSFLINDAFILGGIHERKEFHLTSIDGQFPSIETLWNTEFNRMRPLGRELAILKQAGYRCIKLDANRGITFSSCTLDNAPPLISELQTRLAAIRSLKDFQILLAGSFKSNK